jgi:hypothetical protein
MPAVAPVADEAVNPLAGPPTVGGTPAPLLDIWSAAQAVRVFQADPPRVWVKTPPTPPIPPRGPQPDPGKTAEVPFDDEPIEEPIEEPKPVPMKTSKSK